MDLYYQRQIVHAGQPIDADTSRTPASRRRHSCQTGEISTGSVVDFNTTQPNHYQDAREYRTNPKNKPQND